MTKPSTTVTINTKAWDKIKAKMEKFQEGKGPYVKVGVFQTSGEYPDGMSKVEVAALQEFGSPGGLIPERSFLRQPLRNGAKDLKKITLQIAKGIVNDKITVGDGLKLMGEWGVKTCRNAITEGEGIPPPNAPSTIAKKHSSRPLVDTGALVNSITYQVIGAETNTESGGGEGAGGSDPEADGSE